MYVFQHCFIGHHNAGFYPVCPVRLTGTVDPVGPDGLIGPVEPTVIPILCRLQTIATSSAILSSPALLQ